jgi:hypothetical protein
MGNGFFARGRVNSAQSSGNSRNRLHSSTHSQHPASTHPALSAPSAITGADYSIIGGNNFVMRKGSTAPRGEEAIPHLNTLDRLNSHERTSKLGVKAAIPVHIRPKAWRKPVGNNFDHPTQGVTLLVGSINLCDHQSRGLGVRAAKRVVV